jgi:hypothetical protein
VFMVNSGSFVSVATAACSCGLVEVLVVLVVGVGSGEEGDQVEWRACEAVRSVDSNTRYTAALPHVTLATCLVAVSRAL